MLTRQLGSHRLSLAEDAVQDALVRALATWPLGGVPDNPTAWLYQVARRAALDRLRHERVVEAKAGAVAADRDGADAALPEHAAPFDDDELVMMFMTCHPALAPDARVALTLKVVGGFGVGEIARAFLMQEPAVAQRLVRAKRTLAGARPAVRAAGRHRRRRAAGVGARRPLPDVQRRARADRRAAGAEGGRRRRGHAAGDAAVAPRRDGAARDACPARADAAARRALPGPARRRRAAAARRAGPLGVGRRAAGRGHARARSRRQPARSRAASISRRRSPRPTPRRRRGPTPTGRTSSRCTTRWSPAGRRRWRR